MDGHFDAVSCMAKNPNHLKGIFSGSMDGGTGLFFALDSLFNNIGLMCSYLLCKLHVVQILLLIGSLKMEK